MNSPPMSKVIKMTPEDVHENLVEIVKSMDGIRAEAVNSLGASDEQKQEYLRRTGELASCVEALSKDNPVLAHYQEEINSLLASDGLLQKYDFRSKDFWSERQPSLKPLLTDAAVVVLRDDFVGESQAYHVFQAFKYLGKNGDAGAVYDNILPVNTLLNHDSFNNGGANVFLMKKVLSVSTDGLGGRASVDADALISGMKSLGAMYIDLPKEQFTLMRKKFPRSIMVKANGKESCRVIFSPEEDNSSGFSNDFDILREYVVADLGDAEEDLVGKISNFYGFGKAFAERMGQVLNVPVLKEHDSKKPVPVPEKKAANYDSIDKLVVFDESPAINGDTRTQDSWLSYWGRKTDGRVMMSAKDIYAGVKQLRAVIENGSKEEKEQAMKVIKSLRKDFNGSWIVLDTRVTYNINDDEPLEGRVAHHFSSDDPSLLQVSEVNIRPYKGAKVSKVLGTADGLSYLRAYFGTGDDAEAIMQTLEFVGDRNRRRIKVWTPDQASRESVPDRAAFLVCSYVNFHFFGSYYPDGNFGRSRGVSYSPPQGGGAPKKSIAPASKEVKANPVVSPLKDFSSGINRASGCVYFSGLQENDYFGKYSGIFCSYKNRFVFSAVVDSPVEQSAIDNAIMPILAGASSLADKLASLESLVNSVYAHVQRYELAGKEWVLMDDSESFREPKSVVHKSGGAL